jgi:hypothetical protein
MIKYVEFETIVLATYRRGLASFEEAENKLYGYLKCMTDIGVLEVHRASEEFQISVKKLLDISNRK